MLKSIFSTIYLFLFIHRQWAFNLLQFSYILIFRFLFRTSETSFFNQPLQLQCSYKNTIYFMNKDVSLTDKDMYVYVTNNFNWAWAIQMKNINSSETIFPSQGPRSWVKSKTFFMLMMENNFIVTKYVHRYS